MSLRSQPSLWLSFSVELTLSQHFNGETESQDLWFTDDDNGVAYVAPEQMTEGTWNLYLIAIHPNRQRQGRGVGLLRHVEQALTDRGERVVLVETFGFESFEYVRSFYQKSGMPRKLGFENSTKQEMTRSFFVNHWGEAQHNIIRLHTDRMSSFAESDRSLAAGEAER